MLRLRAARLAFAAAAVATAAAAVDTRASAWSTTLNPASAGRAQSAGTPAAPTAVTATCVASSLPLVAVSWSAVSRAKYTVYQSSTSSTSGFTQVATGLTATSWTSPTLAAGRSYWFQVAASVGTNWKSARSTASAGRLIRNSSPICS